MFEDIYDFLALAESSFTVGMPNTEQLTDAARRGNADQPGPAAAIEGMHKIWDAGDYPIWKMFIEENLKRSRTGLQKANNFA